MEDKGQVKVKLTTEVTKTDTKRLRAKINIQGTPSIHDLMAMAATLNAMLACEIERIGSETGHPISACAVTDGIARNMPKLVEMHRKLIRRKEDSGEGIQIEI